MSPARGPEASGWETRFFCSMRERGLSVTEWGSFWDECRSGNLLYEEEWGRAMFRVRREGGRWAGGRALVGILRLRECFRFAHALAALGMTGVDGYIS